MFSGMLCVLPLIAQNSVGVTGGIHIPTAEMHPAGTWMAGGGAVSERAMPRHPSNTDTHHYFVNFTMFPALEVGLNFTLLKFNGARHYNNQDRNGNVRLRLWKQGRRWVPQVVIGSNSLFSDVGNSRWEAYYIVASRSVGLGRGGRLLATAGHYIPMGEQKDFYKKPFGGIAWEPDFFSAWFDKIMTIRFLAEYDSHQINYGVRCTLFKRLLCSMAWTDLTRWTWNVTYRTRFSLFK